MYHNSDLESGSRQFDRISETRKRYPYMYGPLPEVLHFHTAFPGDPHYVPGAGAYAQSGSVYNTGSTGLVSSVKDGWYDNANNGIV